MPTNGVGNITNAPLFVDTNDWADLRLRPDSPCIDAGNNDFVTWDTDLDGNPRIVSGTVDMGAYEFVPPAPPTPAELVEHLITLVNVSDLQHKQPLQATLHAALASIERGNCHSAVGQLHAFQNKVQAQVTDAVLANELIAGAGQVIAALAGDGAGCLTIQFHELKRHPDGKTHLKFHAPPGRAYLVEGSTNLRDWSPLGAATALGEGEFEFEDARAEKQPHRFYRVVHAPE